MSVVTAALRESPPRVPALYDRLSPGDRYIHATRDAAFVALLRREGIESLAGLRILELGCGEGSLLRTLRAHGASEELLTGVDIEWSSLHSAAAHAGVSAGDIACLPFFSDAFDLVLAFTLFSSVLDREIRRRGVLEAMRVLRPGGLAAIYDFWINPTNLHVDAIRAGELREMFAPRPVTLQRVTLAPPLARLLGGRPSICQRLERLPFMRTHHLAVVRKERD